MRILAAKDYNHMSRQAANLISAQVILEPASVLGLATGSTPVGTYKQLIEWYKKGDVDFSSCKTVNLDEYVGLGRGDENSYDTFMWDNFFSHINIAPENVHIPNGKNRDEADECRHYDEVLASLGHIDLQLLGLGHNGHIAFNEPGHDFTLGTHRVKLNESTIEANRRFFEKEEDVPRYAYTMGLKSILGADRILLLVSGAEKAEILYRSLAGPITPEVPARILQLHGDLVVVADDAALSVIREKAPQMMNKR